MLNLTKAFAVDEQKQTEGVWFDLEGGARIKVARYRSPRFTARLEALQKPYAHYLRRGRKMPEEIANKILCEAMAEALLIDWENIAIDESEGGGFEALPYSRANALRALSEFADFREIVSECAMQHEAFAQEEGDAQKKG